LNLYNCSLIKNDNIYPNLGFGFRFELFKEGQKRIWAFGG